MDHTTSSIILDYGSGYTKAGLSDNKRPSFFGPTRIGRKRSPDDFTLEKSIYFGQEAIDLRPKLFVKHPVEFGLITNWDDTEAFWNYVFAEQLKVDVAEHPVLLIECARNPKINREKACQLIMERFDAPAIFMGDQSSLALLHCGSVTGVAVDMGEGRIECVPAYNCEDLRHAIPRNVFSASSIHQQMFNLLTSQKGYNLTTAEWEIVRSTTHQSCFVSQNYNEDLKKPQADFEVTLKFNEVLEIKLDKERFQAPEVLFDTNLQNLEMPNLAEDLKTSILRCHTEIRQELAQNIWLVGGAAQIPGLASRLLKELISLDSSFESWKTKIRVAESPEIASWLGANVLANQETFTSMLMTKEEYDEYGPNLLHRKFI